MGRSLPKPTKLDLNFHNPNRGGPYDLIPMSKSVHNGIPRGGHGLGYAYVAIHEVGTRSLPKNVKFTTTWVSFLHEAARLLGCFYTWLVLGTVVGLDATSHCQNT